MRTWVYDPHSGGVKIPKSVQERTRQRILAYAEAHYAGTYLRIEVRFRGQFCYIDAYREPYVTTPPAGSRESREEFLERLRNTPTHLGRLRYFGNEELWSYAFYTYSHERYEPCVLDSGKFQGTPEEAFATGAVYLRE
jgi:hypothetical protein